MCPSWETLTLGYQGLGKMMPMQYCLKPQKIRNNLNAHQGGDGRNNTLMVVTWVLRNVSQPTV